ncbi:MAG TPA: RES family NAD+ phosphorylase [Cyclobacteriaceae bacterium]|jgi:RES domain-containing protein|nr:RES family NAD+ phosphorylase [Cyclobacteriaceae bacterium]
MIVYRCSMAKWAKDLSGQGAFMFGGRWNSPGTYLIYAAENNVLAALEVALRIPLEDISKDYVMIPIELPDDATIAAPSLPKNWYMNQDSTKALGDDFVAKGKHLLMKVPSALISDSYNYLINPKHEAMKKVKALEPKSILFDKRLMDLIQSNASRK